jgi:polar amino acid transport system permease protein
VSLFHSGLLGGPRDSGEILHLESGGPSPVRKRVDRAALKSTLIAVVSSVVFFGVVAVVAINAPGWPEVRSQFFDGHWFSYSLPKIVDAFWVNVRLFVLAEVLILGLALLLAVLRSLPGPVFFPMRLLATVYADIFRAIPGLLLVTLLGFGIPGLGIAGVPTDPFIYAVIALTLVYSAYVSEVYRAGIESIHPSQEAAARSLGLSRIQALRYVILPQAVRRVIPPLLNDFIGLQKDTILVSYIGVVEAFRESSIIAAAKFNSTPYVALTLVFLVVTIPLARFTDWLVGRDRRRFQANYR